VDLGLPRQQPGDDPAEAQGLLAQLGADPLLTGRGGVALVEDEVDDLEHRRQPVGQLVTTGHREPHPLLRERALLADDALRDRRLGDEERPGDLVRAQPAQQPQGQRDPSLGRQHGVAGHEHEPQQVVADVVDRVDEVVLGAVLAELEVPAELGDLALEPRVAAELVDRAAAGDRHEPGAGVVGDA